ncbi:MAG TPA: hypothetical protein DGG94_18300 [Micromonosporaceae bacterium]|nr:hypothetical protein [Micromonosporaceae bacterium]
MATIVFSASTLAIAGCAAGTGTTSPSASASPTKTAVAGGPVAACVVGDWTSTEVSAQASSASASGSINGGGEVLVKIASTGKTDVDFSAMQPVKFSASALGTNVKGQFVYAGKASGQIRTGDATSMSGIWEPVGTADWSAVKVTVELTEPVQAKPFENLPIANLTVDGMAQTGGVVDVDPLLGKGKYECGTGTLILSPDDGKGMTWKLTRKSDK